MKPDLIKPISLADQPEQLMKIDDNTIVKYSVVETRIDIGDLEIEKKGIEEQLSKVVTDEQLLEWARVNYPYQNIDKVGLEARLSEITTLLGVK
jgi:hypothetical protein